MLDHTIWRCRDEIAFKPTITNAHFDRFNIGCLFVLLQGEAQLTVGIADILVGAVWTDMMDGCMLPDLLQTTGEDPLVRSWGERFLGIFLIGGTFGGLLFSSLADRWGRNPVMALTILFYSVFSGLTAFASEIWQVGALRFLVAMGVGGEWAVGAALVAEVFPKEARERAGGIFHATSVGGLWLAAAAGILVGSQWRYAYLIGVLPALLVLWVRLFIKEPETWQAARETKREKMGSFRELLGSPRWRIRAVMEVMRPYSVSLMGMSALTAVINTASVWRST